MIKLAAAVLLTGVLFISSAGTDRELVVSVGGEFGHHLMVGSQFGGEEYARFDYTQRNFITGKQDTLADGYILPEDLKNNFFVGLSFGIKYRMLALRISISGSFYRYEDSLKSTYDSDQSALGITADWKVLRYFGKRKIRPYALVGLRMPSILVISDGSYDIKKSSSTGNEYTDVNADYSLSGIGFSIGGGVTLFPHWRLPVDIEAAYLPVFYTKIDSYRAESPYLTHRISLCLRATIGVWKMRM